MEYGALFCLFCIFQCVHCIYFANDVTIDVCVIEQLIICYVNKIEAQ